MRFAIPITLVLALLLVACSTTPARTEPTPLPPVPVDDGATDGNTPTDVTPAPTEPAAETTPTPEPPVEVTPAPVEPTPAEPSGITASELAAHNSRTDCWVAYKGAVYDVTAFLPRHPGGVSAISRHCGTADEFTKAFNRQHGTRFDSRLASEAENMGEYIA